MVTPRYFSFSTVSEVFVGSPNLVFHSRCLSALPPRFITKHVSALNSVFYSWLYLNSLSLELPAGLFILDRSQDFYISKQFDQLSGLISFVRSFISVCILDTRLSPVQNKGTRHLSPLYKINISSLILFSFLLKFSVHSRRGCLSHLFFNFQSLLRCDIRWRAFFFSLDAHYILNHLYPVLHLKFCRRNTVSLQHKISQIYIQIVFCQ